MLRLLPKRLFSIDFEVFDGLTLVARLDLSLARSYGTFTLHGQPFELGREGFLSGAFFLDGQDGTVATATKPSALHRAFVVSHGQTEYFLEAATPFVRTFLLKKGPHVVGTVAPAHLFSRRAQADLPEDLPLEVQIFIGWLVLLMWRRKKANG